LCIFSCSNKTADEGGRQQSKKITQRKKSKNTSKRDLHKLVHLKVKEAPQTDKTKYIETDSLS